MSQAEEIDSESSFTATRTPCKLLSFDRATELNYTLISLLQDLSIRADKEDVQKINDAIDDVSCLSSGICSPDFVQHS
jgi:hypothetical protein